jgi:hypothetical protein
LYNKILVTLDKSRLHIQLLLMQNTTYNYMFRPLNRAIFRLRLRGLKRLEWI